jgi:hypothetical protein
MLSTIPPIYVMAVVTIVVAAVTCGGLLVALARGDRRFLWLILPALPLSALVNVVVKRPLVAWVPSLFGMESLSLATAPAGLLVALLFLSPLTEEAIKVLPLVFPAARRLMSSRLTALYAGLALGIGFGLGEAAFIAVGIARSPQFAGLPWYAFGGYLGERSQVTLAHGLMTAIFAAGLQAGGWRALAGYAAAVLLHALLNVGALLVQAGRVDAIAASLGLVAVLVVQILAFMWLRRRGERAGEAEAAAAEVVYFRR